MDDQRLNGLQEQFRLSFLHGVYLAVDALPGAYLIVDGPYCVQTKAEMQYCHNLRCGFFSPDGRSRIMYTATQTGIEEVENLSLNRTSAVEDLFEQACNIPGLAVLLTTSFDFHQLLNFPLEQIAEKFRRSSGKPVYHIPSRSLGGDWLDGYALTCEKLAGEIELEPGRGEADTVALVGYMFDRDEPDHTGNLEELSRICTALGLKTASVWLSGQDFESLREIERAGLILSLPYARSAANILGERLGVDVLELDLPLGLSGTERFVLRLAERTGLMQPARRFLEEELAAAVRDTERHINRFIAGHSAYVFLADAVLAEALLPVCAELGLTQLTGDGGDVPADPPPLCFAGTGGAVPPQWIHVPFGYPNYIEHPVCPRPFLGPTGFRHLVDRIAMQILRREAARAVRQSMNLDENQDNE
jgi:hypothetical protein